MIVIVIWSALTAVVVMLLYRHLSPQDRVAEMIREMQQLQKKMLSLQASPEEAAAATVLYLRLSLKRMGLTLLPMLFSSLPALVMGAVLAVCYQQPGVNPQVWATDIPWMGHWLTVFLFFSLLFSLALKIALRIK